MANIEQIRERINALKSEQLKIVNRAQADDSEKDYTTNVIGEYFQITEEIGNLSKQLDRFLSDEKIAMIDILQETAASIPEQSSLVRFRLSKNTKLEIVPTLSNQNNYETIEALRAELLAENGPLQHLKARYATNPNVPQAGIFGPLISKYAGELSKPMKEINFSTLFARGSRIYAARRRAEQQIACGEWPELDADEYESIDSVCDLNGPIIMASAVGRKLVEDAHQYDVTPEVYERDQRTIAEFGKILATETELLEPEASEAFLDFTSRTEDDPQPIRSRGLGIAATGSALTVVVGGAAWYSAGGVAATLVVPAIALGTAGVVGGFLWEAVKTTPRFKSATGATGTLLEKAFEDAEKHADDKERVLLQSMANFVERRSSLFQRLASIRPEFGWAKKFLDKVDTSEIEPITTQVVQPKIHKSRLAVPKGTVFEAFRALEMLADLPSDFDYSSGFLQEKIPKNTRQDLSNLGIITSSKGRFIDSVRSFGSASLNEVLLYSVSKTSWFSFAASFLEKEGIRTPSKSFGKALSEEFDLGWAVSSEKRNGQNVKKWVAVLSPMFSDLKTDHPDFFIVQTIKSESSGKGAIPIFSPDFVEEIEFQKLSGKSY